MTRKEMVQAQIDRCLNCKKPACEYGNCAGMKDFTDGIHKNTSEEIDERIRQYFPYCDTWTELSEAVRTDKGTLRRHCLVLGIDIRKYSKKKKRRKTGEKVK